MTLHRPFPLSKIKSGASVTIVTMPAGTFRAQFIRFGITEGEEIICVTRLPGGTLIIQKNRQEIAIGPALSARILVQFAGQPGNGQASEG
jgi:Fe2+ transport system protein FeoA